MFDPTNQYELSVVINERPLTEYQHQGHTFIEGRTNSNYELRVRNNSHERILAILSVDGLCVIDGKPAGADSSGYIIEPWSTLKVPGWKVDGNTAAKFQFGSANGSYSNRTGRGKKNVGVIGMMVFRPKYVPPVNFYPATSFTFTDNSVSPNWNTMLGSSICDTGSGLDADGIDGMSGVAMAAPMGDGMRGLTSNSPASLNSASVVGSNAVAKSFTSQNLGTEYGDAQTFQTTTTTFEKRDPNYPDAMVCIYYDDANGLEARGIILAYRNTTPQAFPTYSNSGTYAAPPPGWTRKI